MIIDHKEIFMNTHKTNSIRRTLWTSTLTRHVRSLVVVPLVVLAAYATALSQQLPVNLGTAGNYVILAKTGVSTTGTTAVTGNIGLSPAAASFITGFSLIADATNAFATSSLVTGKVYASNYATPTPTNLTTAIGDMATAYTNAAGRTPTPSGAFLNVGAGEIGGQTLAPGLYKWTTGVTISTDVTLNGGANDVWIFQIAGNLSEANGKKISIGSAQAKNIFWQVAGQVTVGTTADFKGVILCQTLVALNNGATLEGRALAQTAVTLDADAVTDPGVATGVRKVEQPEVFALSQNYPNPFNPSTTIRYSLEKSGMVSLKVYNILGQEVATLVNDRQDAGSYSVPFNTMQGKANLASGVYFYRLDAGSFVSIKKMILMK
jgi:Ice-binding-like/Secretion system C-terminal sorting domain